MEDRKYISNELVDFPEKSQVIAFLVPDNVHIERDKLEKEPFCFLAESRGNIPSPGSAELENKSFLFPTSPTYKKILKVN